MALNKKNFNNDDIAIISMACHFPDANTPKLYWDNLINKKDSIKYVLNRGEELSKYKGGYLDDIYSFNPKYFGLTPKEVIRIDPQQRLLLRTTDELLKNANYPKEKVSNTLTGVYIGVSNYDYAMINNANQNTIYDSTGNALCINANRISYLYNLHGPSVAIDSACSSSLVTIHMGATAIKSGDCDMAICGGVNIILNPNVTKIFKDAGMLSNEEICKTFDNSANGYVRGEGAGLILLKRLDKAIEDNDKIYAVIKGSAVNQDGKSNGLTAPNGLMQKKVIEQAYMNSRLTIDDIDYIETHGTATKLGDPIELNTISGIMQNRKVKNPCIVGSVKSNIGHLESAAGVASMIKAILMLNKNEVPELLHFKSLNEYIKLNSNVALATKENIAKIKPELLNIAISSFGFGGTNCHLVVSKYDTQDINVLNSQCECSEEYKLEVNDMANIDSDKIIELLEEQNSLLKKIAQNGISIPVVASNDVKKDVSKIVANDNVREVVLSKLSEITAYPIAAINDSDRLRYDLGLDSIMAMHLVEGLKNSFDIDSNVDNLIRALDGEETTVLNVCDEIRKIKGITSTTNQLNKVFESKPFASNIQTKVTDFEEYISIKERMNSLKVNPYYKVNLGVPKDLITTDEGYKINFSTYNYAGLNGNPAVIEACQNAIKKYGTSVSGSRMISGEIDLHRQLEAKISSFLGTEDTIVYVGGYATNVSAISTVVGKEDLILHDALSHNSLVTGSILSGAKRMSFPHNDVTALEASLKKVRQYYRRVLIVVEGVYSMDGDICRLPEIIELKKKYGALLMVDEAHSLGVIGECGRGVGDYFKVNRKDVDLWMGTLSKSLVSCGGYISGSKELVELLKYTSDGFIFSAGITPQNTAAALEALNLLEADPSIVRKLLDNSAYFLKLMKDAGIDTGLSNGTAIVPCIVGDSNKCMAMSNILYTRGINVMPILYPAVPEEEARLRFFISACHTKEQMEYTVEQLVEVKKQVFGE